MKSASYFAQEGLNQLLWERSLIRAELGVSSVS
jgi:hypothetical protein